MLEAIFQKLEQARSKLKPSKCELFCRQITYLGYIVSAQGIATDEGKIDAIRKWPTPPLSRGPMFSWLMGYHHCFILKFMQVAQPLHKLTSGKNVGKKREAITWNYRCQQSFNDLKHLCTMVPILAYANFTKPFKLHTDACESGLGAVLYQTHDDRTNATIAYASRS